MEQQVEQLKKNCPDKYNKFQKIGESYMNMKYDLQSGIDWEGDPIRAELLLNQIKDYNLLDDLVEEELKILERVYGKDWKNLLTCDTPNQQD